MYNIVLINLAPDARSFSPLAHVERRGAGTEELVGLLRNFCDVDPVENTTADAEIRVQVRSESYLIRTEQKKLIFYDAHRRDLPAQIFTVEQAMTELDGSAAAQRTRFLMAAQSEVQPGPATPALTERAPRVTSKARLCGLAGAAVLLLAAIGYLVGPFGAGGRPEGFVRLDAAERDELEATLTGVYLTGNEPGQHGIVVTG